MYKVLSSSNKKNNNKSTNKKITIKLIKKYFK